MSSQPAHLEPSKLGTKEYWDDLYTTELRNHAADNSDIGTCWFDDSDAESRILRFLASLTDEDGEHGERQYGEGIEKLSRAETSFLDLGCGNGSLLFGLRDDGWSGRMLGIDYSAQSVVLAEQIAASRAHENGDKNEDEDEDGDAESPIHFTQWDLISGPLPIPLQSLNRETTTFNVVLDKGTFDAISLSSEPSGPQGKRPAELYRERMLRLVDPDGGLFLITSCNWTEGELRGWFEAHEDGELSVVAKVDYPTFTFGGVKGQTITTLCFQRRVR